MCCVLPTLHEGTVSAAVSSDLLQTRTKRAVEWYSSVTIREFSDGGLRSTPGRAKAVELFILRPAGHRHEAHRQD